MRNRIFNVRNFAVSFNILVLSAAMGPAFTAGARAQGIAEPHTTAAVIADDEGWSKAEETGDTRYVDALLLPEYCSIGSDGSTHSKAAILAHTAKNGNSGEGVGEGRAMAGRSSIPSLGRDEWRCGDFDIRIGTRV